MAVGNTLGRALIEVKADLSDFPTDLKTKLEAALREGAAGVDTSGFEDEMGTVGRKAGEKLGDEVDKGTKSKMDKAGKNAAEQFSYGFSSFLGRVLFSKASMWTTLISAAGSAIASIMPAVYALAGAAPAALGGLVATAVTLKLAFSGMGDALKSALSGQWTAQSVQALNGLAPAARSFVREVAQLRPLFQGLKTDIQQALFVQLEGSLTRVATNLIPTVRTGLAGLAGSLGMVGRSIAAALSTPFARNALASFFTALDTTAAKLAPALGAVSRAVLALLSASSPFVSSLGTSLANLVQRFADLITRAQNSGALATFFNNALDVLRNVGSLLNQILGLWNALVAGLGNDGGVFIGILGQVVGVLTNLFKSDQGQQLLTTLNLLTGALGQLLVSVLTPLLPAVARLADGIGQQLISAIIQLTPQLTHLANDLVPLINFLADHADVIVPIAEGILGIAAGMKAYGIAAAIAEPITKALTIAFTEFDVAADANPIGAIVLAIEAIIGGIILLIMNWKDVKKYGGEAWDWIKKAAEAVWNWLKSAGSDIANFFIGIANWFQALPGRILDFLASLPGRFEALVSSMFHLGIQAIGLGVGLMVAEVVKFPGQIRDALFGLEHLLGDLWNEGWALLVGEYHSGRDALMAEWHALPGQIHDALHEVPQMLGHLMSDAWAWAKREWKAGSDAVEAWANALPGRIGHFFDNIGHSILGGLRSGINSVIDSFNHGIDEAAGWTHIALPHLPHFAAGGIVDKPTLAVIGERAREVVLPTDNPQRAWELLQQSGMLGSLRQPMPQPIVYVTAMLDTGDLIRLVDVQVEHGLASEAGALAGGVRSQ